jgi:hypothetical protein
MTRKYSLLALTSLVALGSTALIPTDASARGGGFHGGGFRATSMPAVHAAASHRVSAPAPVHARTPSLMTSRFARINAMTSTRPNLGASSLGGNGASNLPHLWKPNSVSNLGSTITNRGSTVLGGNAVSNRPNQPTTATISGNPNGSSMLGGNASSGGANRPTVWKPNTPVNVVTGYPPNTTLGGNAPSGGANHPTVWKPNTPVNVVTGYPPNTTLGGNAPPPPVTGYGGGSGGQGPTGVLVGQPPGGNKSFGNGGGLGPIRVIVGQGGGGNQVFFNPGGLNQGISRSNGVLNGSYVHSGNIGNVGNMTQDWTQNGTAGCTIVNAGDLYNTIYNDLRGLRDQNGKHLMTSLQATTEARRATVDILAALQSALQYAVQAEQANAQGQKQYPVWPGKQQIPQVIEQQIGSTILKDLATITWQRKNNTTDRPTKDQLEQEENDIWNQVKPILADITNLTGSGLHGSNDSGFADCSGGPSSVQSTALASPIVNINTLDTGITNVLNDIFGDMEHNGANPDLEDTVEGWADAASIDIVNGLQTGNQAEICDAMSTLAKHLKPYAIGPGNPDAQRVMNVIGGLIGGDFPGGLPNCQFL